MAKRRASTTTKASAAGGRKSGSSKPVETASYKHPEATSLLRPGVGTQSRFRKKKPPTTYRYDSSLSPALEWDGQNAARDLGAWLIRSDLRRARARWIRETLNRKDRRKRLESEFLAVQDASGRVADFHALRVSYITLLVKSGVSVKMPRNSPATRRRR